MKSVEAQCDIAATPQAVWAVLTDAERLVNEKLGIIRLDGRIAANGRFKLWAAVSPKRAFKLKVAEFTPPHSMVWQGGMPLGLFTGRRRFTLTPKGKGVHLHVREEFTGLFSGLIWKSMPDLQPSFDQFVAGVKAAAERDAKGAAG